jgi:HD-GYP domain-containing protein (c-di-GMP phosphodiesterase class II)
MNAISASALANAALYESVLSEEFLDDLRTGVILFGADGIAIDCNRAATELLSAEPHELIGMVSTDMPLSAVREDGSPLPLAEHASARALRTGEPYYGVIMGIDNPGTSRRWLSADAYPLVVEGQIEGAVVYIDDITEQWKQRHMLQLLSEVNRIVMFSSDEIDPLQHLCDALVEHGPYALARVSVASTGDHPTPESLFVAGATDYMYEGMFSWSGSEEIGLGPEGMAMRAQTTQIANDLATQPLFEPWRERAAQYGLASSVTIPMQIGNQKAVLTVYDRHVFAFDEVTVQGLEQIVRQAEFGLDHLNSMKRLATALDGTLAALGQMIETRDPYTAGHETGVGTLGAAIALQLGLDATMIKLIGQSGEVHDIGKIAVPSEILSRPGRLSPLEFEMVKQHTLVGYDILSKASLPWPIAEVALHHHERLDGSGYPDGLLGDQITLPARIIAVADVVEAMTQHRPYRPGLGIDKALAEVTEGAGTRFDDDVVKCCLAVFEAGFTFGSEPPTV